MKPSHSPEKPALLSKPKIINPKSEREMLRAISDEIPDAEDPREKSEDSLKTNNQKIKVWT